MRQYLSHGQMLPTLIVCAKDANDSRWCDEVRIKMEEACSMAEGPRVVELRWSGGIIY